MYPKESEPVDVDIEENCSHYHLWSIWYVLGTLWDILHISLFENYVNFTMLGLMSPFYRLLTDILRLNETYITKRHTASKWQDWD
jgi:hypothetical protein